jgi:hypothetical protein
MIRNRVRYVAPIAAAVALHLSGCSADTPSTIGDIDY